MNLCAALNVTSDEEFETVLAAAPAHLHDPLSDARAACREQENVVAVVVGEALAAVAPPQQRLASGRRVETVKRWQNGELVEHVEVVVEEQA